MGEINAFDGDGHGEAWQGTARFFGLDLPVSDGGD